MQTTVYSLGWHLREQEGEMITQPFGFVCAFEPKELTFLSASLCRKRALCSPLIHSLGVFRAHVCTSTRQGQIHQSKLESRKWGSETQNVLSAQANLEGMHFLLISEASSQRNLENNNKTKPQHPLISAKLLINAFLRLFSALSVPIGSGCAHAAKFKIQHMIKASAYHVQQPNSLIVEYALCHFSTWVMEAWQPLRAISEQWREHVP